MPPGRLPPRAARYAPAPMSLCVVGSIAFDAVESPFGAREGMLGGSAVHFSLAASFFTDVRVVGPVGEDFGPDEYAVLAGRGVSTDDIERVEGGETFFWRGHYEYDLNTAHTDETQLNVFGEFAPKLSEESKAAENLFLANIQPDLQREVREQCAGARFAGLDSMNLWIDIARDSLVQTIGGVDLVFLNDAEIRMLTDQPNLVRAARESLVKTIAGVDIVFMNDAELRMLTEEPNLVKAARSVLGMGPTVVVAKQGEYGAALFTGDSFFALPAYPLETVNDPTGAGDSFAGGFLGYLDSQEDSTDHGALRRAMTYGSTLASFNVEDFGTERVARLTREEIDERFEEFRRMTSFEVIEA